MCVCVGGGVGEWKHLNVIMCVLSYRFRLLVDLRDVVFDQV